MESRSKIAKQKESIKKFVHEIFYIFTIFATHLQDIWLQTLPNTDKYSVTKHLECKKYMQIYFAFCTKRL